MRITRILAATLAVAAISTPAAHAKPADEHAYLTPSAAAAISQSAPQRKELGDPSALAHPKPVTAATRRGPVGRRAWPSNARPVPTVSAAAASHRGPGADWTAIAMALGVGLLVIGATAAITTQRRSRPAV